MNNINELALRTVDAMLEAGFQSHTAWNEYATSYVPIVKLHKRRGTDDFDLGILNDHKRSVEERWEKHEISYGYYKRLKCAAVRIIEMHDTGKITWSTKAVKYRLSDYYESILNEILSHNGWDKKEFHSMWGHARRYFAWLLQEGHGDLNRIDTNVILKYFLYCTKRMKSNSISNLKSRLKKLHRYFAEQGLTQSSYEKAFSFSVSVERKILTAASQEEIAAILGTIDLNEPQGERDYAIILFGAVTGLRAIDISNLKLTDIDWQNGEIEVVQQKTGKPLMLPLTADIGEAIKRYILNSRPLIDSDRIFLRHHAPHGGFKGSRAVCSIYARRRKKAGLPQQGFHALRRAVGRNMVMGGVPVTTVAQVFDHVSIDTTKQYIALDSTHLKECALDFTGIEIGGEK